MERNIFEAVSCKGESAEQYSPLGLAYIGDAVFELFVRTRVLSAGNSSVGRFHKKARNYVNAAAQAVMYHRIYESLSEKEQAILKRGRNASGYSKAKNASVSDYRHSTGLEALFGYLYLSGEYDRLVWLFERCIENEDKP